MQFAQDHMAVFYKSRGVPVSRWQDLPHIFQLQGQSSWPLARKEYSDTAFLFTTTYWMDLCIF